MLFLYDLCSSNLSTILLLHMDTKLQIIIVIKNKFILKNKIIHLISKTHLVNELLLIVADADYRLLIPKNHFYLPHTSYTFISNFILKILQLDRERDTIYYCSILIKDPVVSQMLLKLEDKLLFCSVCSSCLH